MLSEIKKIDAIVEKGAPKKSVNVSAFSSAKTINILQTSVAICGAFQVAKPVLLFVRKYILFWKPKWQTAIDTGLSAVDELCAILNTTK